MSCSDEDWFKAPKSVNPRRGLGPSRSCFTGKDGTRQICSGVVPWTRCHQSGATSFRQDDIVGRLLTLYARDCRNSPHDPTSFQATRQFWFNRQVACRPILGAPHLKENKNLATRFAFESAPDRRHHLSAYRTGRNHFPKTATPRLVPEMASASAHYIGL
jgi:hypothetical protein